MDEVLNKRCLKIAKAIEEIKEIENTFLNLDASRKTLAAQLYLKAEGKNVAEREAMVYASEEWVNFTKVLAAQESEYNKQKRMLELNFKALDCEYLSIKMETQAIRRQV